jgi:hypothetical protein
MNVLYKYCDTKGLKGILETLELKLPYISHVNDPFECLPFIYCPDDKAAIDKRCLSAFEHNQRPIPANYEQQLDDQFKKGELQNNLVDCHRKTLKEYNQTKGCLLSVSENAKEIIMWAHYAERHKGGVIGIDFDNIYPNTNRPLGIKMRFVDYSDDRPKINVLDEPEGSVSEEEIRKTVGTKSIGWVYEKEYRAIFFVDKLEEMKKQGLSNFRKINPDDTKESWLLKLNPASIKEVVFGLYTEKSLKSAIRKLIERPELQHVKLRQAEESETYTLNLK